MCVSIQEHFRGNVCSRIQHVPDLEIWWIESKSEQKSISVDQM